MRARRFFQDIRRHPLLHDERSVLDDIAARYHSDRATRSATPCRVQQLGYTLHYERYFAPLRDREVRLLELGVAGGAGIKMWRDYFPKARIYAVDIDPEAKRFEQDRVTVMVGNLREATFRREVLATTGGDFDIVIDDASHSQPELQRCFEDFFPAIKEFGYYVVEDLQTSYSPAFGSGYQQPGSMLEFLKGLVDCPNWIAYKHNPYLELIQLGWANLWRLLHGDRPAPAPRPPLAEPVSYYDRNVYGVHFYKNIAFVIKGPTDAVEVLAKEPFEVPTEITSYSRWLPDVGS